MYPRILHLYGPLYVHSYGVAIVIGAVVLFLLTYNNPKIKNLISYEKFLNLFFICIVAGIIGGRLMYVITEISSITFIESLCIWNGGFYVLGSIISILSVCYLYLLYNKIKVFLITDVIALYVGVLQCISRLGCFLAGCCYGAITQDTWYSIRFFSIDGLAPLNIPLYATQLYASITSFFIFIFMRFVAYHFLKKSGQLTFLYLVCESISRFIVDYFRGDRGDLVRIVGKYNSWLFSLSLAQIYSLFFLAFCLGGFIFVTIKNNKK